MSRRESLKGKTPLGDNSTKTSSTLNILPDIIIEQILSCLHWKEKINLSETCDRVSTLLHSPLGWACFDNRRNCDALFNAGPLDRISELEKKVVERHGKYFQHCTLRLDVSDFVKGRSHVNSLLQLVTHKCKCLKSLCIFYPPQLTYPQIKACCMSFLRPIQKLLVKRRGKCSLSMRRTFYKATSCALDVDKYLALLIKFKLHPYLTCCDAYVSGMHNEASNTWPLLSLPHFKHLQTLKCSVHAINETIIISLLEAHLVDLFLRNDQITSSLMFSEIQQLNWVEIYQAAPTYKRERFQVHYIFQNRVLNSADLSYNPFARSLVFDNLLNGISHNFLNKITDLYGPFLTTLAFGSNFWEFSMHFTDLESIDKTFKGIGLRCRHLTTFLSCLRLPSSTLHSLADNSPSLVNLHVYKHKVKLSHPELETVESFQQKISRALHIGDWKMHSFGANIFDVPGIDPLLFSSCENYCFC